MARNGSGTYSLPAGNPVVTGTVISSSVHNNTMSDIANEITNSVDKDGQTVLTGALGFNGNRLILDQDADTSFHADTDDQIDVEIAGSDDFSFKANNFEAADGSAITLVNGNVVFSTAGTGLDFSSTADGVSMSSELFDDYEEGSFTPSLADNSLDGSGESQTYDFQLGRYIKVGRIVFFWIEMRVTSIGSLATGEGARVMGLPFTSLSTTGNFFGGGALAYADSLSVTAGNSITGVVGDGVSYAALYNWDATAGTTIMTCGEFSSGGYIYFNGSYEV